MELYKASQQWSKRPADERFWNLGEMHRATKAYADASRTAENSYSELRAEADQGEVKLTGKSGVFARLTHWAFGQVSRIAGAPAEYLRNLPATLAVQNLNHGLKKKAQDAVDSKAAILFHQNGDLVVRAINSEKYDRIWNHEIVGRLLPLEEQGWKVPPARPVDSSYPGARKATAADVPARKAPGGLAIEVGDMIAPAGLYASDHDMFAFLVNEKARIADGTPEGLARGFFVENSEVGAGAFKLTQFLYRYVCGNHIVWGASDVREISIRHIGSANEKAWKNLRVQLVRYAEESASDLEAKIKKARTLEIAKTKDEVLDKLFGKRIATLGTLENAYHIAESYSDVDGAPTTLWGMAQGLTRLSQLGPWADKRNELDRAAGKLLEIVF